MTKVEVVNKLSRAFHKVGFEIKKHSPEILVVTGVIGLVGAGVCACKATTKLDAILTKSKENTEQIKECLAHPENLPEVYTEEDGKKDLAIVRAHTALDVVKLYAPSVAIGALSIGCIFAGNNILRKRNIALGAAYAALDSGFKDYRKRVIERFGEGLDKELKFNIKSEEVKEVVTNEKGEEEVVTKTVAKIENKEPSIYTRFYDAGCTGWTKDPERNLWFLKQQQNWANEKLKAKGYLTFNEVLESLGLPASKTGAMVGWKYDPKRSDIDNYVDFGIFNGDSVHGNRDFVNGYEQVAILDFNVQGYIWD